MSQSRKPKKRMGKDQAPCVQLGGKVSGRGGGKCSLPLSESGSQNLADWQSFIPLITRCLEQWLSMSAAAGRAMAVGVLSCIHLFKRVPRDR